MRVVFLSLAMMLIAEASQAQTTPTPVQKKAPTWVSPQQGTPVMRPQRQAPIGNWQRFKGASRCEQVGNVLSCDNGYRQTLR